MGVSEKQAFPAERGEFAGNAARQAQASMAMPQARLIPASAIGIKPQNENCCACANPIADAAVSANLDFMVFKVCGKNAASLL
jgi:hypothetical protein